jgi:hypothetical protein
MEDARTKELSEAGEQLSYSSIILAHASELITALLFADVDILQSSHLQ